MSIDTARRWLDSHLNREATAGFTEGLSLAPMEELMRVLGDPQDAAPVIHLTGTNGKGSTARIISSLLVAAGLSVGTYGSPHLQRINERFTWNQREIDDDELAAVLEQLQALAPLVDAPLSWFELTTAAAFRWFADIAVDVAVIEVGLLGEWDATNVVDGQVAVVTNITRDHTDGQGDWRRRIASEKAGIIKPGATLVLGETDPSLADLWERADAVMLRDRDFGCENDRLAVGGRLVDLRTPEATYDEVFLPLHGAHQADNTALALAACEAFFGRPLADEIVRDGLANVTMPGRFEVVGRDPLVVIDGAHNPAGAAATAKTLVHDFDPAGSRILVFGMLSGRDPAEVLAAFAAINPDIVLTVTAPSPRGVPSTELADQAIGMGLAAESCGSVEAAIARAFAVAAEEDAILISGSLYVAGEARTRLLPPTASESRPPEPD